MEGIIVVDRRTPEPAAGQALVRVGGSCLNFHDTVVVRGLIPGLRYPLVPLSDGCGEVVALGDGVSRVSIGDRVTANFYPDWLEGRPTPRAKRRIIGERLDGWCAEYIAIEADALVRAPAHLDELEAATLPCAALTAWSALGEASVRPGDLVVVQGTGGVSLFTLQFAKAIGASVLLTSSSDEKLERGRSLGADHLVNYREHPDWASRVVEISDGRGADVVVDVGGQETLGQAVLATRMDGHVSLVGVLSGYGAAEIPVAIAMTRNIAIKGITVGSRRDFEAMNAFIEQHSIRPVISDTFEMADLSSAVEHIEQGRHFGKVAIAP